MSSGGEEFAVRMMGHFAFWATWASPNQNPVSSSKMSSTEREKDLLRVCGQRAYVEYCFRTSDKANRT